nr:FtsX-like permease family protein [Microbacterium sp. SORGH_AS_0888]
MGASVLVAAISTAFAVLLLSATELIAALMRADSILGESGTVLVVLSIMTVLLVGLAVYVASIVVANTFATIVAGRTRRIALMRLIGASARSERRAIARQGLAVGAVGAVLGLVGGTAVAMAGVAVLESALSLHPEGMQLVRPVLLLPAAIVVLTTWAAAWAGSRRVLTVTPLQALGDAGEPPFARVARRTVRNVVAIVLFVLGAALLGLGVLTGMVTPLGVVIAFFGGVFSFTGIVLGATLVMPPLLRLVGRAFGRSATARLAAENALRSPERSSRMAIGVVMGVTLVTMFAVALQTVKAVLSDAVGGEMPPELATGIDTFSAVMMALIAVSAVIAGVGLVNLLVLGVVQRRRELALLRTLGLSNGQVRTMVLLEATHVTVTAVVTGLVLGIGYGWAGAQSLLGSVPTVSGEAPLVAPALPAAPLIAIVAATALLTVVAAVVPTRLATRVTPVAALASA